MRSAPDLLELRRWTRLTARRRRRATRTLTQGASDLYSLLIGIAVWTVMLVQLLGRSDVQLLRGSEGAVRGPGPFNPMWLSTSLVLVCLSVSLGAVRRLGPLFLRPEQVGWWLPRPGERGRLMRLLARRLIVAGAMAAATAASLLTWMVGGGPAAWAGAASLGASVGALALVLTVRDQIADRAAGIPRAFLLGAAVAAFLVSARDAPDALGPLGRARAPLLAGGLSLVMAVVSALLFVGTVPGLEQVPEVGLVEASQRGASLRAVGLALDTRALGAVLAPPLRRPRRPASLRLARWGPGGQQMLVGGARPRTVLGVAQADLLLLARQPWRCATLAGLALAAGGTGLPLPTNVRLGMLPVLAWLACLLCADAARRAQRDGGPDTLWPATATWVRVGHLVLPALAMGCWWATAGLAVLTSNTVLGAHVPAGVLGLGMLSSPGWAGVALRSGFRRDADWSMVVPTPLGAIPQGLIQTLTAGLDAAVLVSIPLAMAQKGPATGLLWVSEAGLSALTLGWGLMTGRDFRR